jgi:HD-GYP domain-containing protein (c-di-GMP phosphodiesterase class II)
MQTLKVANLKVGSTYSQPMFSASGQKLLNAGVELSDRQISAILRAGELEVYLADSTGELQDGGILNQASPTDLQEGTEAQTEVLSQGGNVLVEAGEQIERHHLDAIAASGGAYVPARVRATKRRERILLTEALVEDLDSRVKHMELRVKPLSVCDWLDPLDADDWPDLENLQWQRERHVEKLHELYAKIEAGVRVQIGLFDPLLEDLLGYVKHHNTRVAQLALLVPRKEDYLPDHAYTVAILAMATATRLRWPPENVREIGLTGLLFDPARACDGEEDR